MTSAEARHLTRYLREHRICKPFSKAALARGTKIEKREHPGFTKADARRIARDHLCAKGDRAYPVGKLGAFRPMPGTEGGHTFIEGPYLIYRTWSGEWIVSFRRGNAARSLPGRFKTKRAALAAVREHKRFVRKHFSKHRFDGFVPGRKVPRD